MSKRSRDADQLELAWEVDPKAAAFISLARAKHGDRYSYGPTRFLNNASDITIGCPRHGLFTQNPGKHLRGHGCRKCGNERRGTQRAMTAGEAFVNKARAVHGDRYGYESSAYRTARTPVTIRCPKHGLFQQEARVHLAGSGCLACGSTSMAAARLNKTAAGFIERAKAVHGDRYDYGETAFTAARAKIAIRCLVHGPFHQYPHGHLSGSGCPRCAADSSASLRRRDQAEFVAEAIRVHGHLYDYGLVDYRRRSGKVTILCATHGEFEQSAGDHLQGRGCPACGSAKQSEARRRSRDEFIEAARAVHGDRYGYEDLVYERSNAKVQIHCPTHGLFEQEANVHLKGSGCSSCAFERLAGLRRKDTRSFVREATRVHRDLYDYGLTNYTASDDKVVIECRQHGPFEMTPSNHLNGQGCRDCGVERIRKARQKTQERFLEEARQVHGPRYDYRQVAYEHSHVLVTILCRTHGPFGQSPSSHLQGHGCPRCNHFVSKPETEWLDSLVVPDRSVPLVTRARVMVVDGYDPDTRTAYLFHGDYWHGNPAVFPPNGMHAIKKKPYGELYRTTLMEEDLLREAGYRVVSIWERDYHALAPGVGNGRVEAA